MKLVVAYIQPQKLNSVKQALFSKEIFKLSVTNALGCGQQKGFHENYRGVDVEVNLRKKVRIEIIVNDEFVQQTKSLSFSSVQTIDRSLLCFCVKKIGIGNRNPKLPVLPKYRLVHHSTRKFSIWCLLGHEGKHDFIAISWFLA